MTADPATSGGLEASSLVELAVQRLRSEILSGALVPGERLVEEQLTRRFGTSRAPLREAMRLLGQQGLVEHLPRRGVRVAQLSARDIEELFSLRDVLERFALRSALDAGPEPRLLDGLRVAVEEMERAAADGVAYGIVADYGVTRFFADSEALYSYEGTYQMQNLIVGKAVTGLSAFI